MDPQFLVEAAIALAGLGAWLAAFGGALFVTRPRPVAAPPPTQDFGGSESPAVVSMITGRWELTEDAAESTLIDLAARRVLEFRQPGNDPLQTTVHVREAAPSGLNAYETMIFERIKALAMGGMVPLTALTFRDEAQAAGWTKRLNAAIVADARSRGLSQRRFSKPVVTALSVFALVPAFALTLAALLYNRRTGGDSGVSFVLGIFMWFALFYVAGKSRGERDTPAGRQAAARWLGLKAYLRAHESFADLPPAAVTVWDRYLSYGDAVGATRVCAAVIDLGMGNRNKVWSSFGGTWHRVKVKYPSVFPRYGQKALRLALKSVAALVIAALITRYNAIAFDFAPDSVTSWVALAVRILILWPLLYGGYTLLGTLVDVLTPVTVTGEVLWLQTWKTRSQGEDEPSIPVLHHLAVDAGVTDRTVAWACPSEIAAKCDVGDIVTLTARRWTRRVLSLQVDAGARMRRQTYGDEKTDALILNAMNAGAPALATAVHPTTVTASSLVTAEEAGRVLGRQVTLAGRGGDADGGGGGGGGGGGVAIGPMTLAEYVAADRSALLVTVVTGTAARFAIGTHRGGTPVPGVGEEAFASGRWAVARRGETVIKLEQRTSGTIHQPYLVWLLGLAVARLP
ncbi:DUF2207 domain-containing protein [Dactylosporangium vinaceum]|uniref:DUF2207 family protein n=1 Tax=Dactylosporangium vinaceum TaxID=53362 RepID=A0ABV5MBH9_9ACTN|nr:DUF2207 domain-containing protein [Dactylosporangium vinaceum]UAB98458.1 DUF2207 domain-containing protein [Dactylosporangium vinaceum]